MNTSSVPLYTPLSFNLSKTIEKYQFLIKVTDSQPAWSLKMSSYICIFSGILPAFKVYSLAFNFSLLLGCFPHFSLFWILQTRIPRSGPSLFTENMSIFFPYIRIWMELIDHPGKSFVIFNNIRFQKYVGFLLMPYQMLQQWLTRHTLALKLLQLTKKLALVNCGDKRF